MNNSLASDLNNREFVGAINPDDVLTVKFYIKSEYNEFESTKQGRPIFYEADFVQIMKPGDSTTIIEAPVRPEHKIRFPRQWAMFQEGRKTEQLVGTPVEQWTAISRSQADELKGVRFYTVEQIANASDLQAQAMGMNGPMYRQKARAFLESAKDSALSQFQATELAKKDQQIKDLTDTVARLAQTVESIKNQQINSSASTTVTEVKPKRKYTKKEKPTETLNPVGETS